MSKKSSGSLKVIISSIIVTAVVLAAFAFVFVNYIVPHFQDRKSVV